MTGRDWQAERRLRPLNPGYRATVQDIRARSAAPHIFAYRPREAVQAPLHLREPVFPPGDGNLPEPAKRVFAPS